MSGARLPGTGDRPSLAFTFEGRAVSALAGDTIAMALWAAGEPALRASSAAGSPRGVFCNMGVCYECLVVVDGVVARACMTAVRDGMQVRRGGRP